MLRIIGIIAFFLFVGVTLVGYTLLVFRRGEIALEKTPPRKNRSERPGLGNVGYQLRVLLRALRWRVQTAR